MKKILLASIILSLLLSPTANAQFSDLASDHPNKDAILNLKEKGCLNGYEDGSVKPDNSITRAETLKLILTCTTVPTIYTEQEFELPDGSSYIINGNETNLSGETKIKLKTPWDPATYPSLEFDDINQEGWYINVLKEGLVRQLITGYADNTIKPLQEVKKADFFTMLHRVVPNELQSNITEGTKVANDVYGGQWFANGLSFALDKEIISKDEEENINPLTELSRGQVAQYIYEYNAWLNQRLNPTAEATPDPEPTPEPEPATPTASSDSSDFTVGYTEAGIASYYGNALAGARTASGETYQPDELIAAHKTLPFGTIVRVTNPDDGAWVEVRIIDRGPYVDGRIIDLSTSAFEAIKALSAGLAQVEMEVISLP